MNINATLFGELFAALFVIAILIMGPLCFYLGKRKTDSPYLCGFVGFFSAFLPPLGLIFLGILALKADKPTDTLPTSAS